MSVGRKIQQLRLKSEKSQREVAETTGLAISYLSRLENGHLNPSVGTLAKISKAFEVPLSSFFDSEPALEAEDRCPVSPSGICILDQPFVNRGRKPRNELECYSPQQLKILRMCSLLLQTERPRIVRSLHVLIESLFALAASSGDVRLKQFLERARQNRK
jgi:transcriptional regulator with XRE-family HTH domain